MLSVFAIIEFLYENTFIITLVIAALLLFISRRYNIVFMRTESTDTNHCNDPNCVRCMNYNETVSLALSRIKHVQDRIISVKIQKGIDFKYRSLDGDFKQRPNVFYYDNLTARSIWSQHRDIIIDSAILENAYKSIQKEVEFITNTQRGTWKRNRTPNGAWDVFHLINQGSVIIENQKLCPQTMGIINSLTSVMRGNVFGNVMISVLKPGTEITPHYGPTNIRLRSHLGLQVTPHCKLTVDDDTLTWERGKCLVFDDSFLHSVNYACQGHMTRTRSAQIMDRIVLIVDLWHPDLTIQEREAINCCFEPKT